MLLTLQILYHLKVNEITLKDISYYECIRNNFSNKKKYQQKLLNTSN